MEVPLSVLNKLYEELEMESRQEVVGYLLTEYDVRQEREANESHVAELEKTLTDGTAEFELYAAELKRGRQASEELRGIMEAKEKIVEAIKAEPPVQDEASAAEHQQRLGAAEAESEQAFHKFRETVVATKAVQISTQTIENTLEKVREELKAARDVAERDAAMFALVEPDGVHREPTCFAHPFAPEAQLPDTRVIFAKKVALGNEQAVFSREYHERYWHTHPQTPGRQGHEPPSGSDLIHSCSWAYPDENVEKRCCRSELVVTHLGAWQYEKRPELLTWFYETLEEDEEVLFKTMTLVEKYVDVLGALLQNQMLSVLKFIQLCYTINFRWMGEFLKRNPDFLQYLKQQYKGESYDKLMGLTSSLPGFNITFTDRKGVVTSL